MGYYTDYDFTNNSNEVIELIHEISDYSVAFSGRGRISAVKWYEWKDHLKDVSLQFPDQVITIEGEGEESGDIWKAYFKNGKSFKAQAVLTFEEFDESKLK